MKYIIALLALALSLPALAASHTATLNYTASPDSTTASPGTVDVYRATGACPSSGLGTLTFTKVDTTPQPPAGSYVDTLPGTGTYCYYLIFNQNGASSAPSNTGGGTANPFPAVLGTVVVQ